MSRFDGCPKPSNAPQAKCAKAGRACRGRRNSRPRRSFTTWFGTPTKVTTKDRTPNPQATVKLFEETKKRGLLIGKGGLYGNTIRIAPALNVGAGEVDEALKILADSFAAMGA